MKVKGGKGIAKCWKNKTEMDLIINKKIACNGPVTGCIKSLVEWKL
jgi:hypothetical protein